jgi:hypothetical protein
MWQMPPRAATVGRGDRARGLLVVRRNAGAGNAHGFAIYSNNRILQSTLDDVATTLAQPRVFSLGSNEIERENKK